MTAKPTIRVFVSSPGDVAEERAIAGRILQRVADRFSQVAQIEPVFWEHEPLLATDNFQAQIPRPAAAEIFICILWSRLGTRLPASVRRPDGSTYQSGTEFEFEDAIAAYRRKGMPDLIVYRKTAEPVIRLRDRTLVREALRQGELLDAFLQEWFHGADGTLKAAFHSFKDPSEFEEHLELHLIKLIGKRVKQASAGAREQPAHGRVTWTAGSPYRGLEAFDVEHESIFFGRTGATSAAIRALRQQASMNRPFLLILGASGSGKSSLARAGVLPMLMRPGVAPGVAAWRRAIMRPSDAHGDLLVSLATALLRPDALPELVPQGLEANRLADLFRKDHQPILDRIGSVLRGLAGGAGEVNLALVIDQLEEVFTLASVTDPQRQAFFRLIEELTQCGVWVIATLRSDFYHRCAEVPELGRLKAGAGQYDVQPPTASEIAAIIRQPAVAAGLRFEHSKDGNERLQELLADDAARCPESLPLLSFTLDELYKHRSEQNALRLSVYHQLGRLEGALAHRAGEVFAALPKNVQLALPRVFRQLVTLGAEDDAKAARKPAATTVFARDPAASQFVKAFIEARLFTTKQTADGSPIIEITHEALLTRWKPAQRWLASDRDHLRVWNRVKAAAKTWEESRRSTDRLLARGQPLDEAKHLLDAGFELTASEHALIRASRDRVSRNRQMKRLAVAVLAVLSVVLALVSVVGFFFAERNRRQSEENFTEARKTVDEFVTDISREELSVIPGLQDVRQKFAQRAVDRYEQFASRRPNDGEVRAGLAQAKVSLGQVIGGIGSLDQAVGEMKGAIELLAGNVARNPSNVNRYRLAKARNDLGQLYWSVQQKTDALLLLNLSVNDLEAIVQKDPTDLEARYELAVAYNSRGNCRRETDDSVGGRQDYERSRELHFALIEQYPKKIDCYAGISAAVHNLSLIYKSKKDYAKSLALLDESAKYDQLVLELAPTSPRAISNNSIGLSNRGRLLANMGKREEADQAYTAAVAASRRVVAENPKVTRYQWLLADTLKARAGHLTSVGQFAESKRSYEEAVTILDSMITRLDDRPAYAVALIQVRSALASFHSGTTHALAKRNEAAYVKALDETVESARHCSARFPRSADVAFELGKSLYERSHPDHEANRWEETGTRMPKRAKYSKRASPPTLRRTMTVVSSNTQAGCSASPKSPRTVKTKINCASWPARPSPLQPR